MKTTHIGSLPFNSLASALNFTNQFSLPVLPALPMLDKNEFMLDQVASGINGSKIVNYKIYFSSLELKSIEFSHKAKKPFLEETEGLFKWQIIGPLSLLFSLGENISYAQKLLILDWHKDNIINFFEKEDRKNCYFFLDEPMLFMAKEEDYLILNNFIYDLRKVFFKVALHCCSSFDSLLLDHSQLDGLSLLSRNFKGRSFMGEHFIGILNPADLSLDPYIEVDLANSYLTPHCGLALSDIRDVVLVPRRLSGWSK